MLGIVPEPINRRLLAYAESHREEMEELAAEHDSRLAKFVLEGLEQHDI